MTELDYRACLTEAHARTAVLRDALVLIIKNADAIASLDGCREREMLRAVSHCARTALKVCAPYPEHCHHPEKCCQSGRCQRDPVCID
jgi:hypothetical protein